MAVDGAYGEDLLGIRVAEEVLQWGVTGHKYRIVKQGQLNGLPQPAAFTRDQATEDCVTSHHGRADDIGQVPGLQNPA